LNSELTSTRPAWLALPATIALIGLWAHGPVAQWNDYHAFADTRSWLGLPNVANVLSNLPFALVAWVGLMRLRKSVLPASVRLPWLVLCASLVFTAAGSALYHWAPNNAALVADRIPIAWACAALLCAFLAERADPRWADPMPLAVTLLLATAAVGWWWFTEQRGWGDLRPYLAVQFLPMLLVPVGLCLKLPERHAGAVPASAWWAVLGWYGAAKVMELADAWVLGATQVTSGHTLKHLLAAVGAAWIVAAATRPAAPAGGVVSSDSPR
jgi:hypothetical protein